MRRVSERGILELDYAAGDTEKGGEVASSRTPPRADPVGGDAISARACSEMPECGLEIEHRDGKACLAAQAVVQRGDCKAAIGQPSRRSAIREGLRSTRESPAVDPDHEWEWPGARGREIEIEPLSIGL